MSYFWSVLFDYDECNVEICNSRFFWILWLFPDQRRPNLFRAYFFWVVRDHLRLVGVLIWIVGDFVVM